MMKATLDVVLFLLTGLALGAASVAAGLLGLCAVAGVGGWWWLRRRGRRGGRRRGRGRNR